MEEAHGNIRSNNENSNHEWFGDNQFSLPEFSISSPSTTETLLQRSDSSHRRNSSLLDSASAVRDQDGQSPSGETGDLSDAGADRGLAISNVEQPTTPSETATPKSTDPFLSPEMSSYKSPKTASFQDSFTSTLHQPFVMDDDTEELNPRTSRASTIRSYQSTGVECPAHCRSKRNIHQGRSNWLAITILILAVYSTIFSGIWLLMAIVRPRWGHRISTTSSFNPGTASLVTALFAKTIELSFVTVFVSFLGQVISRRAFVRQSKGITIAEMSMRSWIMQPGTMITHFESVKHAGLTYLGVIALLAALMAMLYTSASDALVSPKLGFGPVQKTPMYGLVHSVFGSAPYIESNCQSPIPLDVDPDNKALTCLEISFSGQAYHDYTAFLANWTDVAKSAGTSDMKYRPRPTSMLFDNTTIQGSWIENTNMTAVSISSGRMVNNVTAAMPHPGVFQAAIDPTNNILQPQDLSGLGEYFIGASTVSPAVNVLCATVTADEINPLVYTSWPRAKHHPLNATLWPNNHSIPVFPSFPNATVVDALFGFGEGLNRRAPVFPKFPLPFNTVFNDSIVVYGADAVYLLVGAPTAGQYALCSMSVSLSSNCSTKYHGSISGASLESNCEDPKDDLAYVKSNTGAHNGLRNLDWPVLASQLYTALSLGTGITDGDASNSRLLAQLIPTQNELNPKLPSIAEALAVMSSTSLLMSAQDSPFQPFWNYSNTILDPPQYQSFNATLQSQDFASSPTQKWQSIFYIVLLLVFMTNVFCLIYFIFRGGLVTDFIEPQNLFALALNSPPSQRLAGACGCGPEKDQFSAPWFISVEDDHVFIENPDGPPKMAPSGQFEGMQFTSPIASTYSMLSRERHSFSGL